MYNYKIMMNHKNTVGMMFNNMNPDNIKDKISKFKVKQILRKVGVEWFARYVILRARHETNNQELYSNFIHQIDSPRAVEIIRQETYKIINFLLAEHRRTGDYTCKHALISLGKWLGLLTLGKDVAIDENIFNLEVILIKAYGIGNKELIFIIPFVGQILGATTKSKVFNRSHPWVQKIINMLLGIKEGPMSMRTLIEVDILLIELGVISKDCKFETDKNEPIQSMENKLEIYENEPLQSINYELEIDINEPIQSMKIHKNEPTESIDNNNESNNEPIESMENQIDEIESNHYFYFPIGYSSCLAISPNFSVCHGSFSDNPEFVTAVDCCMCDEFLEEILESKNLIEQNLKAHMEKKPIDIESQAIQDVPVLTSTVEDDQVSNQSVSTSIQDVPILTFPVEDDQVSNHSVPTSIQYYPSLTPSVKDDFDQVSCDESSTQNVPILTFSGIDFDDFELRSNLSVDTLIKCVPNLMSSDENDFEIRSNLSVETSIQDVLNLTSSSDDDFDQFSNFSIQTSMLS